MCGNASINLIIPYLHAYIKHQKLCSASDFLFMHQRKVVAVLWTGCKATAWYSRSAGNLSNVFFTASDESEHLTYSSRTSRPDSLLPYDMNAAYASPVCPHAVLPHSCQ